VLACVTSPGCEAYDSAGQKQLFLVVMETCIESRGKCCSLSLTWGNTLSVCGNVQSAFREHFLFFIF